MKLTIPFICVSILLLFCKGKSFRQTNNESNNGISKTFKITLKIHYYPTTISTAVNLSNNQLTVIKITKKDSLTFSNSLQPSIALQRIADIDFTPLKGYYSNPCIDDGIGLDFSIENDKLKKSISLDNYYQNEIAQILEFVNGNIPSEYKIWYDKETLTADYIRCKAMEKQ